MTRPALSQQCLCAAVVLSSILADGPALAQTNLETNAGIQFNFSVPGAANLAMGGAFLSVADDATAAYTNPAGLTQVYYRELHLELRAFEFTHVFTDRGRAVGPPMERGIDRIAGLEDREASDRAAGPSFLAYVHRHRNWSFALYRHELARFEAHFDTQGAFLEQTRTRSPLGIPGERDGRLASLRNSMDLLIVNYGIATGWRVRPHLSVGGGLSYFDFSIDSTAERFVPALFEEPDFDQGKIVNVQRQTGEDHDWGFTLGFLWEATSGRFRAGGVYRHGPSFALDAQSLRGPGTTLDFREFSTSARFDVPRVLGLGFSWLPNDLWRVTLDWDRVFYNDLARPLVDIFDLPSLFQGFELDVDDFTIDDADEIHLGFERYFLGKALPVAFRAGVWFDPDHSLRFEGENVAYRAIFRKRSDELHATLGVGFSAKTFQVHLAVDLSHRVSTVSLSAIYHF